MIKKPTALTSKFVETQDSDADASWFLLLSIISNGCLELQSKIKNVLKNNGDKLDIYKSTYGTSISSTFYIELAKGLEQSVATINSEKLHSNLLKQYHFYFILNAVNTSMMLLNALNIPLSTILYEKEDYDWFMKAFDKTIAYVISNEFKL